MNARSSEAVVLESCYPPGVWVSYHENGYPAECFAVHSTELYARRFAMDSADPSMKVAFLPFDVELRDHLSPVEATR